MLQLIRNDLNIGFVKARWIGFAISGIMILAGIYATVQIALGHAKMGVEFSGGTALEVEFPKAIHTEVLRAALKTPEFQDASIQTITDPGHNKFMLRIFAPSLQTAQVSPRVHEVLLQKIPDNPATVLSSEDVGPSVSAMLRQQAVLALFWAMVGILIYIWWRFDFRFAVAATVATIHDLFVVLGIMYFLGYETNLLLLTALLTIAGYSLNDTVVVFDRIRENLRLHRKEEFSALINNSINETLSRTIITSLATMLVVVALMIFGGEVIHLFSVAMALGIVIGTYSSIFIASNIAVEWNIHSPLRH
jgi:preprotein translocase subunit SecF